jgi:hypothetical protein
LRHQDPEFFLGQLKHEVSWKLGDVSSYLFIQPSRLNTVQPGKIGIKNNTGASNTDDVRRNLALNEAFRFFWQFSFVFLQLWITILLLPSA